MEIQEENVSNISSEDIARGLIASLVPLNINFNSDGSLLTFLYPDSQGNRQVHSASPSTGFQVSQLFNMSSQRLSLEEKLRRERMRMFVNGVATYEWCKSSIDGQEFMMVPMGENIIIYDRSTDRLCCLYDGSLGSFVDPHVSPTGNSLIFVINKDMYMIPLNLNALIAFNDSSKPPNWAKPIRLTHSGEVDGISCGLADYVAQEEMDRYRGFWYSPNGNSIAYTLVDETCVSQYNIAHQGKDDPAHAELHRYPFAGTVNPKVKLAVMNLPIVICKGNEGVEIQYIDGSSSSSSSLAEDSSVWMDLVDNSWEDKEYYLARCDWWPDGTVMAQIEDRRQQTLQLLKLDPKNGMREILLEETGRDVWINLHDLWHPIDLRDVPNLNGINGYDSNNRGTTDDNNSFAFIWGSERSDFMQLYLYIYTDGTCTLVNDTPITIGGEWIVDSIVCVDVIRNRLFFSCNLDDHTGQQLYCVPLFPVAQTNIQLPSIIKITDIDGKSGTHSCTVSARSNFYCDVHSDENAPPLMHVRRLPKLPDWKFGLESWINEEPSSDEDLLIDCSKTDDRWNTLQHHIRPPIVMSVLAADGTPLLCACHLPPGLELIRNDNGQIKVNSSSSSTTTGESTSHLMNLPCIMSVYGGPHVQRVRRNWSLTANLREQRLAERGFIVIKCDNRGSSRRGLRFEGKIKNNMGDLEVSDQAYVVKYFASITNDNGIPLVDVKRVGIYGWSYGGYMTAMSMCKEPELFRVGVSGAPVTHWDGYDTHYTERYMGLPQENRTGYEISSVMAHVPKLLNNSKLLLVHGLIDENVHFRHTARLINALIKHRKRYDLLLFPCERHSPRGALDRVYLEDRILEYFIEHLGDPHANYNYDNGSNGNNGSFMSPFHFVSGTTNSTGTGEVLKHTSNL